jgi:hypothetical protein
VIPARAARHDEPADLHIRRSTSADAFELQRLAQLDGAPRPVGEHLLAEEAGVLRAALPLDGGPAIADPFHPTADIVAMLSLRTERLQHGAAERQPRRGLRAPPGHRLRGLAPESRHQPA